MEPKDFYYLLLNRYQFPDKSAISKQINTDIDNINVYKRRTSINDVLNHPFHTIFVNNTFNIESLNKAMIQNLFDYLAKFSVLIEFNDASDDLLKLRLKINMQLFANNKDLELISLFIHHELNSVGLINIIDYMFLHPYYLLFVKFIQTNNRIQTIDDYIALITANTNPYIIRCKRLLYHMFEICNINSEYTLILYMIMSKYSNSVIYRLCKNDLSRFNNTIVELINDFDSLNNFKGLYHRFYMFENRPYISSISFYEKDLCLKHYFSQLETQIPQLPDNNKVNTNLKKFFIGTPVLNAIKLFSSNVLYSLFSTNTYDDKGISFDFLSQQTNFIYFYITNLFDKNVLLDFYQKTHNEIYLLAHDFLYVYLDIVKTYKLYSVCPIEEISYVGVMSFAFGHISNFSTFLDNIPLILCDKFLDFFIINSTVAIMYNKSIVNPPIFSDLNILKQVLDLRDTPKFLTQFNTFLTNNKSHLNLFLDILKHKSILFWRLNNINVLHSNIIKNYMFEIINCEPEDDNWDYYKNHFLTAKEQFISEQERADSLSLQLIKNELVAKPKKSKIKSPFNPNRGGGAAAINDEKEKDETKEEEEDNTEIEIFKFTNTKEITPNKSSDNLTEIKNIVHSISLDVDVMLKKYQQEQIIFSKKFPVHQNQSNTSNTSRGHCPDKIGDTIIESYDTLSNEQLINCYCDRIKRQNAFDSQKSIITFELKNMYDKIDKSINKISKYKNIDENILDKYVEKLENNAAKLHTFEIQNNEQHQLHKYPITKIKEILNSKGIVNISCD